MAPTRKISIDAKKFYFSDTSFNILMRKRIYHVLLISSAYDAFMLEEDGRIDEQIFNEYVSLNLRYPPQFIIAHSPEQAFRILEEENIDLIITMLSAEEQDTFDLATKLKKEYEGIPIVVLTPFSREVSLKISQEDLSNIDHIFSWLGNADLLLAIIKLIEDKMNVDHDVHEVGVQVILLVEDSIRFYSSYLPNMYKIIFKQSKTFMTEGLNEHQKMLRMRGRPKIMLATNYEEALGFYEKYKSNMLGIISDASYNRNGVKDKIAGIKLSQKVKKDDRFMPILLQSSEGEMEKLAKEVGVGFLKKNSKTLSIDLRNFIREYFAFGDFIFQDPKTGNEIARAEDLKTLQEVIFQIPDDSIQYHIQRNHFSKWLRARALFPLAEMLKDLRPEDFNDIDEIKRFIFDAFASFRLNKARGVIADFYRDRFDEYFTFTRIGEGSIGGKARGLAFLDSLIKRNRLYDKYEDVVITIPRTVVLGTDIFDEFMEDNNLYKIALSEKSDEEILKKFIESRLPFRIHEDLYTFISVVKNPIAVRSSSLLEDSHYQPFAGVYSTYMIPNVQQDERLMIDMLSNAIKGVYASAFYKGSKAYMTATANVIDEEKMGIVLQEVCGNKYGTRFYPAISGVARSINFYPIEPEKPEQGIANIALGLGKYIVDGGVTLRFSPKFPKKVLQISRPEMALKETQKSFYALDLNAESFKPAVDDSVNLMKLRVAEAEKDGSLKQIASTYDFQNDIVRDGISHDGKRLITFSNILKYDTFPLAKILENVLYTGQREMAKPIEIEFAVELNLPKGEPKIFNLLQIRPIVDNNQTIEKDLENIPEDKTIIYSNSALGNGIIKGIRDFVYIKPDAFDPAKNSDLAMRIGDLNDKFIKEQRNYVLAAPGRWGSSDPWLGIPVKWPQISAARVIIESGLSNYRIDPSQGTHFFQNLTSFRVIYLTINPFINDGFYDLDYLSKFEAEYEDEHIRHIRFEKPILIEVDGQKNIGLVYKMEEGER
ncbi:MAG: phosphoenolpyruvate synthase [Bacteroidales bacterium]|nr:phosphoenolpyruvate synthase [Bacteroidales bacterium]MCF8344753.1 phosphoenolpyruvate synthase [Bacteroidales bacterium]MCF8377336.1 phosphoenolpyruvate synthase [Bacteroidales bacterium]MCF8401918.1 phosphoenolpyruvate synthase [Bacteroidales bacterium]